LLQYEGFRYQGWSALFLFVAGEMNALVNLLETTLAGMGYELVDLEQSNRGKMLQVFIDLPYQAGAPVRNITVDDCQAVSNQLTRLFAVEGVDYDRLEISSPGMDRVLRKQADFERFAGEQASVKMRLAVDGRKKFTGVIRGAGDGRIELEIEGGSVSLDLANLDKARLVPKIEF
jgi:ribosome maturation factor RimP